MRNLLLFVAMACVAESTFSCKSRDGKAQDGKGPAGSQTPPKENVSVPNPRDLNEVLASPEFDSEAAHSLLLKLSRTDVAACLKGLEAVRSTKGFFMANDILLSAYQSDPEAFKKWAASLPDSGPLAPLLGSSIVVLSAHAPRDAFSLLRDRHEGSGSVRWDSAVTMWATNNPEELLQYANANFSGKDKSSAAVAASKALAATSPAEALKVALSMEDSSQRGSALSDVMSQWLKRDSAEAIKTLKTLNDASKRELANNAVFLAALASKDMDGALGFMNSVPLSKSNKNSFVALTTLLAEKSPQQAYDLVTNTPAGPVHEEILSELCSRADAATVRGWLAGMTGTDRNAAFEGLAGGWGRQDMSAAVDWSATLKDDEQRYFQLNLVSSNAGADPKAAANLLLSISSTGTKMSQEEVGMTSYLGSQYYSSSHGEALQWLSQLPEPYQRAASSGISSQMIKDDVVAAGDWINRLPEGAIKQEAVKSMVKELNATDPASAAEWAKLLPKAK